MARPSRHVSMSIMMTEAINRGNQPPSNNFNKFDAQKAKSTAKKKPVAAKHH